jgi:hypothetical protein
MKTGSPFQPVVRSVFGKRFLCLQDQSAPDLDVAALEKRKCNRIIAQHCKFDRGLDAFAGVGVSARYWSKCTRELYLVENRKLALELLQKNLPAIARPSCRVKIVPTTAQGFIESALRADEQFNLVDLDPFGTCYELLPLIESLVRSGVVCITSGEIFQVYRGLNRRPGRPPAEKFRGHRVKDWVVRELIPEIVAVCRNARLVHFYAYPTSVRIILAIGGFRLPKHAFRGRPNFLGWLGHERNARALARRRQDSLHISR